MRKVSPFLRQGQNRRRLADGADQPLGTSGEKRLRGIGR